VRQLEVPAAQEAQEEVDDSRPKWDTAPPTTKREWKSSIALMKKNSAPFMASLFPSCLIHAEADLKPKKDFKEATLRTNVAGACGLALVRCEEMAFSFMAPFPGIPLRMRSPSFKP
jgi:hypothetical protein